MGQGLLNPANYHPENKMSAYLRGVAAWYKYRAGQPIPRPVVGGLDYDFVIANTDLSTKVLN